MAFLLESLNLCSILLNFRTNLSVFKFGIIISINILKNIRLSWLGCSVANCKLMSEIKSCVRVHLTAGTVIFLNVSGLLFRNKHRTGDLDALYMSGYTCFCLEILPVNRNSDMNAFTWRYLLCRVYLTDEWTNLM